MGLTNLASKKFGMAILTQFCLWDLGRIYPGWSMIAVITFGTVFVLLQGFLDYQKLGKEK